MDKRILLNYGTFQVDRMVFSKDPKPKHAKRLSNPIHNDLIHVDIDSAPVQIPPANSSPQTLHELKQMANDIAAIGVEEQQRIVKKDDSSFEWRFEKICKKYNLRWNQTYFDQLIDESGDLILNLKYRWNRPRPFQLAPKLGVEMHVSKAYTASSPSFPSGHSAQSQLIADVLSKLYPSHTELFQAIPEKVAYSRYIGGLHFPSDLDYGKQIGRWLANNTSTRHY